MNAAKKAAGEKDVRIGGGVSTVQQYLRAQLIDEMHLALAPVLLGEGENLWRGLDLYTLGYKVDEHVQGERALHLFVRRR
jgi:dihydrofolate reductase